ncbi:hypothetical protein GWN65_00450 [Candidatus Bathyarchaeota archaeon]|nr:hypothetical protein [Candidatus Bathyarchaeota archaeon]NIV43405.1 hypothetical protein [Candidatus Bathyarchaeota archaeon]
MPRELCVGNGNFQVNFDNDMNIRDMHACFIAGALITIATALIFHPA